MCVSANTEANTPTYYQTSGKLCAPCPSENYSELLKTAGPFAAFLVVVFVLVVLAVWLLEIATNYSRSSPTTNWLAPTAHEGSPTGGKVWLCAFMSSKDFCVWTITSAQILATASSSEVPGEPELITKLYKFVSFFNLDTRQMT